MESLRIEAIVVFAVRLAHVVGNLGERHATVPRREMRGCCFWQLGLAHFGSLIWPTPWDVEG